MNTENWYAAKNFQGLDVKGKPCDYKRGDVVHGVHTWPTFSSLRNISWIVNNPIEGISHLKTSVTAVLKTKTEKKAVVKTEIVKPVVKQKTETAKKIKKIAKQALKNSEAGEVLLPCDVCDKAFKTSRALKMHQRYHK